MTQWGQTEPLILFAERGFYPGNNGSCLQILGRETAHIVFALKRDDQLLSHSFLLQ